MKKTVFGSKLTAWYEINQRDLPWRHTHDPYRIWLSEIILQQTQIKQGLPYYIRFVETFPTLADFYAADTDHILKLWEGLGYYRRALNMIKGAKYMVEEYKGKFPSTYKELINVPGIGDYTASAIASFAFDQPEMVIDGNVIRVMTRHHFIDSPVHLSSTKRAIREALQEVFVPSKHYAFNQGIMELGATVCKPKKPLCSVCPVEQSCIARAKDIPEDFPIKQAKKTVQQRYFHFFIHRDTEHIYLTKRTDPNDIWYQLYTLPSFSTLNQEEHLSFVKSQGKSPLHSTTHLLSHQKLFIYLWDTTPKSHTNQSKPYLKEQLSQLSFPKPVVSILNLLELL